MSDMDQDLQPPREAETPEAAPAEPVAVEPVAAEPVAAEPVAAEAPAETAETAAPAAAGEAAAKPQAQGRPEARPAGNQRREPRGERGERGERGPRPQREQQREGGREGGRPQQGGERRGPRPGGGPGGDRRDPGKGGRPEIGFDIDLDKLIADSLYLDNQAHAVVSRMRDMDSGTRSQLRRLYSAVRRACRAAEGDRQHQFVMLRARLAYTIARHQLRSLDGLEKLLLQVTRKNDARGYERFRDLFEAIVAYNE